MKVEVSVEFYRHLMAVFGHPEAPEVAEFLALELPAIVEQFATNWNSRFMLPTATSEYRRSVIDVHAGRPCVIYGLLRPDGVIELERISIDWNAQWNEPDED